MTAKLISDKYRSIGSYVLIGDGEFAVFGDPPHTDLVCIGSTKTKSEPTLYLAGIKQSQSKDACRELQQRVKQLQRSNALASFSLTDADLSSLKRTGGNLNATHIRLHSHNDNLRVVLFDYRTLDATTRLQRKNSHKFRYIDIGIRMIQDFSCTLLFESFNKLPMGEYDVRIGDNGITQFTPQKQSVAYLLRDQRLIEPMTVFHSPLTSQDIAFVFHPKSTWADPHTTQSLS